MESDGTWTYKDDDKAIRSGVAFMVLATDAVDITINNTDAAPAYSKSGDNNIWFTVSNDEYTDVACIKFKEGKGFNKLAHYNENAPMLYVSHDGEDYAAAHIQAGVKTASLCFKTSAAFGKYTLKLNANGDFSYLHLIDRLTGEDVDMLVDGSYTFIGAPGDREDRFVLRFEPSSVNSCEEVFAYQSGNDIIVNGEGTLQVYDVLGRFVASYEVSDVTTIERPAESGLYIFKLIGEQQKTQKIVVR